MKVTRIAYSYRLNAGKYAVLCEQAARLGRVRSGVWQRYGSVAGVGVKDRQVRDQWLATGYHERFGVLANAWKETVRDAMGDIAAYREAAKVQVRRAIARRTTDPAERKRLFALLKSDRWVEDRYLARQMRSHCKRGKNRTANQIVVRADQHHTEPDDRGRLWLAVPGLRRRQLVKIALNTTVAPTGTLRLILRNNRVEIHYQIAAADMKTSQKPCGDRKVGVEPTQAHPVALTVGVAARHQAQVRTEIFTAVHRVVDKAAVVVAEDLTKRFAGHRSLGRNMNRRLAGWTKGVTAEALKNVSQRRGSALRLVNCAYTSQVVPCCQAFGRRSGDRLYCTLCGVVWHADQAGALNVAARDGDPDIALHTPCRFVRQILLERAERLRTRLPVQDSSRARPAESELSNLLSNEQ